MGRLWAVVAIAGTAFACGSENGDGDGAGGTVTMTGGVVATGGAVGSGGSTSTGGSQSTGGSESSGGSMTTGGDSGSGGSGETGGSAGTGGTTGEDLFDSDNAGRNDVVAGDVCGRLATLQCAGEANCCSDPGRTFEQCRETVLEDCVETTFFDKLTANEITGFDADRAKAALLEFETQAKACKPEIASWGESADGLRGIMQGTVAAGESCVSATADVAVFAARLASCAEPATTACLPTSVLRGSCVERGDVGDTCYTDINCKVGLYCPQDNYTLPEFGQECAERLNDGTECTSNNECKSLACKGDVCVAATDQSAYCLL